MGPICQSCLPTDETVSAERGIIKQEWKLKVETKSQTKKRLYTFFQLLRPRQAQFLTRTIMELSTKWKKNVKKRKKT